jgi:hypothetical protein
MGLQPKSLEAEVVQMALTDVAVKNAKPGPKRPRLKGERGLFLEISPAGGKRWRPVLLEEKNSSILVNF